MGNKTVVIIISWLLFISSVGILHAMQPLTNIPEDPPQQEVLDKISLRIIYTYNQQAVKEREKITVTDTMALEIGQNWSVYYDWNKARRDSISFVEGQKLIPTIKTINVLKDPDFQLLDRYESKNLKPEIMNDRKGEDARIFKHRIDNRMVTIDTGPTSIIGDNKYLRLMEVIPPMDWVISEDTLSVLGYACYKATSSFRGRDYIVWFSPEIPVDEGPWKLYGLPGAILSAETTDGLFHFHAVGIEQTKDVPLCFPTDKNFEEAKNLKQVNDFRRSKLKSIFLSYMDNGNMTLLNKKNPVEYSDLELSE